MNRIVMTLLLGFCLVAGPGLAAEDSAQGAAVNEAAQKAFEVIKRKVAAINGHAQQLYQEMKALDGRIQEKDREIKSCESRLQVYLQKMKANEGLEEADYNVASQIQQQGQAAIAEHKTMVERFNSLKGEGRDLQGIREALGTAISNNDMAGVETAISTYETRFGSL